MRNHRVFFCALIASGNRCSGRFFIATKKILKFFQKIFPNRRKKSAKVSERTNSSYALWQQNIQSSDTLPELRATRRYARIHLPLKVSAGHKVGSDPETIPKYPAATDKAMTDSGDNDTSLRSWRRTRQGWDSHGPDSLSGIWCIPFLHLGFRGKIKCSDQSAKTGRFRESFAFWWII